MIVGVNDSHRAGLKTSGRGTEDLWMRNPSPLDEARKPFGRRTQGLGQVPKFLMMGRDGCQVPSFILYITKAWNPIEDETNEEEDVI